MPLVRVTGAASPGVVATVAGRRRRGRLLHVGRDAAYVDLGGTCVAVLARGAVLLPCGVRTTLPALPGLAARPDVVVGEGALALPGLEVRVTDSVETTVPVLAEAATRRGAAMLGAATADGQDSRLDRVRAELPADALGMLAGCDPAAARGLLGLGSGLTPAGDDVLAGWLATGVATHHPAFAQVHDAVASSSRERTTTLSATLLDCAARGEAVPQFLALLGGVADDDPPAVARATDRMLRIGDTSGAGLLLGSLIAFRSLPSFSRQSSPPPLPEGATG